MSAAIAAVYIRTCCSSAVYIVNLRSYVLQNLVSTNCCPTFARAARLPPLPLATFVRAARIPTTSLICVRVFQNLVGTHCCPTFVRAARMPSTPLTCVRTCCRTSLVHTADLHSYMLRICRHCRWLHSYVLLVCRQHHRPPFVRVATPRRYARLSYIRTCCASAAIAAGYIRTCYSSAVNIVDLRSYVWQNLVATHRCPTFVRAARLPSTSSTCIRTPCRSLLVHTALVHSYALLVCSHHC